MVKKAIGYTILALAILTAISAILGFLVLDIFVVYNPKKAGLKDVLGRPVQLMPRWLKAINPFQNNLWAGWKWFFIDGTVFGLVMLLAYGLGAAGVYIADLGESPKEEDAREGVLGEEEDFDSFFKEFVEEGNNGKSSR
jgi:hypothetical protein